MKIPSLPVDKLITVDKNNLDNSDLSEAGRQFLDILTNQLQTNASDEGLVCPSQNSANITIIQNNKITTSVKTPTGVETFDVYTCQPGTFIYNTDTNQLMVAILVAGKPVFKTVTVT